MSDIQAQHPAANDQQDKKDPPFEEDSALENIGAIVTGVLTGTAAGAAVGAAIGTIFLPLPVMGTVVGAFLGASLNAYLKRTEKLRLSNLETPSKENDKGAAKL